MARLASVSFNVLGCIGSSDGIHGEIGSSARCPTRRPTFSVDGTRSLTFFTSGQSLRHPRFLRNQHALLHLHCHCISIGEFVEMGEIPAACRDVRFFQITGSIIMSLRGLSGCVDAPSRKSPFRTSLNSSSDASSSLTVVGCKYVCIMMNNSRKLIQRQRKRVLATNLLILGLNELLWTRSRITAGCASTSGTVRTFSKLLDFLVEPSLTSVQLIHSAGRSRHSHLPDARKDKEMTKMPSSLRIQWSYCHCSAA